MTNSGATRKRLSLTDKVKVINFVKAGNTQKDAAVKFKCSRPAVVKMMKDEESIRAAIKNSSGALPTRKIIESNTKCKLIESMLHHWHMRVQIDAPTLNITGHILQQKALEFRDVVLQRHGSALGATQKAALEGFQASNGWLANYTKRVGTRSVRRCGEHSSADTATIEGRLKEIRLQLEGVPLECIFNIDESALLHRTTSSRSYVTVNSDNRGVKRSKERITFTPIVSASGEKLELQVIGKSKNPRAMKGIDINAVFGVHYEHQSKAWQDGGSMMRLFHRINRIARRRKSILYLLLDNCSSHVWAAKMLDPNGSQDSCFKFDQIVIIFFPPNATSDCQPLDQGIIRSIKAGFRKAQLRTLFNEYELWQAGRDEMDTGKFPFSDHTHIRNAMHWLKEAWDSLGENVIRRCFAKANCLPLNSRAETNQDVLRQSEHACDNDSDVTDLADMLGKVRIIDDLSQSLGVDDPDLEVAVNKLVGLDKDVPTGSDEIDEDEIISTTLAESGISVIELDDDEAEDDDAVVVPVNTAIAAIDTIRSYMSLCPSDSAPSLYAKKNCLADILLSYQKHLVKEQTRQRVDRLVQPCLTSFFKKSMAPRSHNSVPNTTPSPSKETFVLPTSWEEMDKLYLGYHCEGHGKGPERTVQSMTMCVAHLRAWVNHVDPGTNGVAIANMHIERIEKDIIEKKSSL